MGKVKWAKVRHAPAYAVSDHGLIVRRKKGERGNSPKGAVLSQRKHQGFLRVCLYIGGKEKKYRNFRVDYLVLEHFKKKRPSKSYYAEHLDENPDNNQAVNLCWRKRIKAR